MLQFFEKKINNLLPRSRRSKPPDRRSRAKRTSLHRPSGRSAPHRPAGPRVKERDFPRFEAGGRRSVMCGAPSIEVTFRTSWVKFLVNHEQPRAVSTVCRFIATWQAAGALLPMANAVSLCPLEIDRTHAPLIVPSGRFGVQSRATPNLPITNHYPPKENPQSATCLGLPDCRVARPGVPGRVCRWQIFQSHGVGNVGSAHGSQRRGRSQSPKARWS